MTAISRKMHIDSRYKQFTFLLCLITNYRLIFLWKAQMVANSPPPLTPLFQYGKSLLKSKKILFLSKKLKFYAKSIKTTTYVMICYETAFWIDKFKMAAIIDKLVKITSI